MIAAIIESKNAWLFSSLSTIYTSRSFFSNSLNNSSVVRGFRSVISKEPSELALIRQAYGVHVAHRNTRGKRRLSVVEIKSAGVSAIKFSPFE